MAFNNSPTIDNPNVTNPFSQSTVLSTKIFYLFLLKPGNAALHEEEDLCREEAGGGGGGPGSAPCPLPGSVV